MIVDNAQDYKTSYTNEVKDMTTILDPENTIKDAESSEVWRQYYVDQYQLKTQIIGIDDTIVGIIK